MVWWLISSGWVGSGPNHLSQYQFNVEWLNSIAPQTDPIGVRFSSAFRPEYAPIQILIRGSGANYLGPLQYDANRLIH